MGEPHQSRVYSDFARFYDHTFGRIFVDHEHETIEQLNLRPGQQVLEVGVGTGISLDAYPPYVKVVGIDPSTDMLAHAVKKTR
jgi:phosphatidylethanolamine/phosphatidyl-N-methylethanolamine N-methyltransferase